MRLAPWQTRRFYHIWFALLRFVNDQRHLVPAFASLRDEQALSPADELQLRDALWADETLLEDFLVTNPADLASRDLDVVASWRSRLAGNFFVVRSFKRYTVFLSEHTPQHAYGVVGLLRTIEEAARLPLPFYTRAVLLPFEGQITYDGLLHSSAVSFGPRIRRVLADVYRHAKEREGIITSLPAPSSQEQDAQASTEQTLQAFRRYLFNVGLGPQLADQHVATIQAFAQAALLTQDPPRALLATTAADLQTYLPESLTKETRTGFKRFVSFLAETRGGEEVEALRQVLKQREADSKRD
jgi:hypothetical protein